MGESAPDFEPSRQTDPNLKLRGELRETGLAMAGESDPLTREIGFKLLSLVRAKDMVDGMFAHRDDPSVYQQYKMLGIFILEDGVAIMDYQDPQNGFAIRKGDRYLGLHLRPVSDEDKSFSKIGESLEMVADYITRQSLDIVPSMMGVTFERLAEVSRRIGFSVADPRIDERSRHRVQKVFDAHYGRTGRPMGKIMLIHQPTAQFIEKYKPSKNK
jgi:hypothetical protein